jgi:DNA-binding transcriptional LysR family regulator
MRRAEWVGYRPAVLFLTSTVGQAADGWVSANLVRHGLGTMFMPASDASRFPDLRAVPLQPTVDWQIYLAMAANGQAAPASAKLAEMLLASAGEVTN